MTGQIPERLLVGRTREFDIDTLVSGLAQERHFDGERNIFGLTLPPWQRPEVWGAIHKKRFIEGIFLGLGTGYYVTNGFDWGEGGRNLPMSGWLLDGQQRISAIRDFVEDRLEIFDGVVYSQIDKLTAKRRFLNQTFPRLELEYTNEEEKLRNLYERLNFGGIAQTESDHATFKGSALATA